MLLVSFDPRAREGRDQQYRRQRVELPSFDPRAREGRDSDISVQIFQPGVFRSARP